MTVPDIIRQVEATGARLEPRGERIWCSDPALVAGLLEELKVNRDQVLVQLRAREHARLVAGADELGAYLDDPRQPHAERGARLAEYQALLDKIAELQPYIDQAGVAGSAANAAQSSAGAAL